MQPGQFQRKLAKVPWPALIVVPIFLLYLTSMGGAWRICGLLAFASWFAIMFGTIFFNFNKKEIERKAKIEDAQEQSS